MPRGGPREGGGRPELPPEDKRVQFWARLRPATKERIERMAQERGVKVSDLLEEIFGKDLT